MTRRDFIRVGGFTSLSVILPGCAAHPTPQPTNTSTLLGFTSNSVPYLKELSEKAKKARRIEAVQAAIESKGYWEDAPEWRIFTQTHLRIEPVDKNGQRWYRVQASCEHEMSCLSPTIQRAIEFLGVYEQLIQDLFWTLDWPHKPQPGNS